ncbi:hypothetical protein [Hydrogenophaga sp. T2]|uniref:hypothetical protein n=1 Tax=Hydrogenophaga sp. T2 TaxID=3132823 RepID=UPI003CEAFA33
MKHLRIGDIDLSEYVWQPTHVHDRTVIRIDRAVMALDPEAEISNGGPGERSGIQWSFLVTKNGQPTPRKLQEFLTGEDEQWQIALSYRGPLITAISFQGERRAGNRPDLIHMMADKVTSPALVAMTKKLADDLRLVYLDAGELMALEIPWDELQGNAADRLDYSEMPNAFNLLFYEY